MRGRGIAAVAALVATAGTIAAAAQAQFYVPTPNADAQQQIAQLTSSGDKTDAGLVSALASTPHGVWIVGGSPNDARVLAQKTVNRAAGKNELPVLVAYNIPGRDCSGFSAGGATDLASYEAWIDGLAAGIGNRPAMVILEPDSLGLLPQANCGSTVFTDADRYAELQYAVGALGNARVYLDATHSAWMSVGDIAARLVQAGVTRAAGFFLNVSNYQYTTNEVSYGTWISKCIASGDFAGCPNQYWNGGPATNWQGTALTPYKVWTSGNADLAANTAGIDSRYASMPAGPHFVIDTSRNGRGPWQGDQDWCNPPGRGTGPLPTAATGNALVDAYLWVKVPGESDGQCRAAIDPAWNVADPAAGVWFPQQALQLAQLAQP
jgi:endoglucanase